MKTPSIHVIGELINNSYARARSAWEARDVRGFQALMQLQAGAGAEMVNVNIDGTQRVSVTTKEMLDFLPKLIPALQEVSGVPLSFDNPNIEYHLAALKIFDRSKCTGKPVFNSLAASRNRMDEMIALIREHDMRVIVMASEKFHEGGGAQCLKASDSYETVKRFTEILVTQAGRTPDDIIVDVGLAPVGADTYGLVNIGLDAMKLISADPHLEGIHMSVGLSNFAWGTPRSIRYNLERAYLTIAGGFGLDHALCNVEKNAAPLPADDPLVGKLEAVLETGRVRNGETQEQAGFRQAEKVMELCMEYMDDEE